MASQNKITVSFGKEYQDIYEYLKKQPNASKAICEAVRSHINGNNDIEKIIEKIIEKTILKMSGSKLTPPCDEELKKSADIFSF